MAGLALDNFPAAFETNQGSRMSPPGDGLAPYRMHSLTEHDEGGTSANASAKGTRCV